MLDRSAESGGHQQRTEVVTVKCDSMGFVVDPRTADVRGG